MMMRPPGFMCLSAACVATSVPRTLMSITRSISSSVVSSKVFGMAVPALFTSTSSRPKVATVFSTAPLTASMSAAFAWIATAFPPLSSIALTTAEAALASFAYVMATLAPSAARRFAIAAPMPREPPVTSATLPASSLSFLLLMFCPFFVFRVHPVLNKNASDFEPENWLISTSILLWASHDVHMRVGRSGPHDVRTGRLVGSRQSGGLWIEQPHNHPVRTYSNRRTRRVIRIGIATLRSACQHIGDAGGCVGRLGFVSFGVGEPLHGSCIHTHGWFGDNVWIARHTREVVAAFAQHNHLA